MNNESSSKDINNNQNRKKDNIKNNIIVNKRINNISKDEIIIYAKKNKTNQNNFARPATALNLKKNTNLIEQASFKQNENEIVTYKHNKKFESKESKTVNANIYNTTMNSLGKFIQTSNFYKINKKMSNISGTKK